MDGITPAVEHHVLCHPSPEAVGAAGLRLSIDGREVEVLLEGSLPAGVARRTLSDRLRDLLDIACVVQAAHTHKHDAKLRGHGGERRYAVQIPVRDIGFWRASDTVAMLQETVRRYGDDVIFSFDAHPAVQSASQLGFDYSVSKPPRPNRALVFTSDLAAVAGAINEVLDHGQTVLLIALSVWSGEAKAQKQLSAGLSAALGTAAMTIAPVNIRLRAAGRNFEPNGVAPFLSAALGATFSYAAGLKRVSIHRDAITSLGLQRLTAESNAPADNVTSPTALAQFTQLMTRVAGTTLRVDNPFQWTRPTKILAGIEEAGLSDLIKLTTSCEHAHHLGEKHRYCGRCWPCVERRLAIMAEGLEENDPLDAYQIDPMGSGGTLEAKPAQQAHLMNLNRIALVTAEQLGRCYPSVTAALERQSGSEATKLTRLTKLLNRHGAELLAALDGDRERIHMSGGADSLAQRNRDLLRSRLFDGWGEQSLPTNTETPATFLEFDSEHRWVRINETVILKSSAMADMLIALAENHLAGAGKGLALDAYPRRLAREMVGEFGLNDENAVRQCVCRTRKALTRGFEAAGLDPQEARALIESGEWRGYRLAPENLIVRRVDMRKAEARDAKATHRSNQSQTGRPKPVPRAGVGAALPSARSAARPGRSRKIETS